MERRSIPNLCFNKKAKNPSIALEIINVFSFQLYFLIKIVNTIDAIYKNHIIDNNWILYRENHGSLLYG